MSSIQKSLLAVLILSLVGQGLCQCSLNNIQISQSQTGQKVQGKFEYLVTLSNNCICTQSAVTLNCPGFNTVEPVDPSILTINGNVCELRNPIYQDEPVSFKYAWDSPIPFSPKDSTISCSK